MLAESGVAKKELKAKKFSFVIKEVFLSGTLQNLIEELQLSSESVLQINYFFALDKPKPEKSIPQDEWISHIQSNGNHFAAAFFNGDVKFFEGATEKLVAKALHQSQITGQLFFKSSVLNQDVLVTCSELPDAAITVSAVKVAESKPSLSVIARANVSEIENAQSSGFSCLAANPSKPELFVSSTSVIEDIDEGIQIWKIDPNQWQTGERKIEGSFKRQKLAEASMNAEGFLKC